METNEFKDSQIFSSPDEQVKKQPVVSPLLEIKIIDN
jgi:hypothetical protein